jgi:hypothetical protein
MSQMSFSDFEYAGKRKQTRRERFLAEMDQVVPWSGLLALIEPYYPKAGGGRKPYINCFRYPRRDHRRPSSSKGSAEAFA